MRYVFGLSLALIGLSFILNDKVYYKKFGVYIYLGDYGWLVGLALVFLSIWIVLAKSD